MAGILDCRPGKCRNIQHADYIISCVTKESLQAIEVVFKNKCGNAARITDKFGRNALHIAVSCGKYDVAEWLINQCGVEIGLKDSESGWNSLHRSLYYGNIHCAVLLLQNGLDFAVCDRDGVSPLKLVHLDSQRAKTLKKDNIKLGRVILPYHASEPGELSLEIDDLVDILKEYNTTGWGFGRINGTRDKGKFPLNFIAILGDRTSEFSDDEFMKEGRQSDVYMWGNNANLTLGQPDTKNREDPELVESLWSQKCNIKQVAVSKFHTVFLCEDGSIFICGQGRGGRLGLGHEQTILRPKQISSLHGVLCTAVSTANDHTLILDQMGQVYSFGLNKYHQLGHHPAPAQCLNPKMISHKSLKGKIMIGVAAARFHSAIFTKNELFTFGLNAGQLGHLKGDQLISVPRLVTLLFKKELSINSLAVSDGATCCSMSNGDIYILQDYGYRRIATKIMNIKKLVMIGGELSSKLLEDLQNKDPEKLCIACLKVDGMVCCWRPGYSSFKECFLAGKRKDSWQVVDVCLGKHLLIATDEGIVFHGHFRRNSQPQLNAQADAKTSPHKSQAKSSLSLEELAEKWKRRKEEQEEVMIERVPLLYRTYQVACDLKSRTFAAVQNDPKIGLKRFPGIARGSMDNDLKKLLREADSEDNIHDVLIKAKNAIIVAHRFILISRLSQSTIEPRIDFDSFSGKYVMDLKNITQDAAERWLSDVYTGKTSDIIQQSTVTSTKLNNMNGHHQEDDFLVSNMKSFCIRDLDSPDCLDSRTFCDENGTVVERISTKAIKRNKKKKSSVKDKSLGEKHENAVASKLTEKGFSVWQQMGELSDIIIESEDGVQFRCHKCILVARLEYFQSMLSSPWMESSWKDGSIKMPMPEKILKIVLDFLYIDEAPNLKDCTNIELLCDVIIYADQLLIGRLKEICETSLAKQISLKNALEMLEFSCLYNADQLKLTCCEFVCINLTYYLELRALESLSCDVLEELSSVYKDLIPNMAYRRLTPYSYHLEQDAKEVATKLSGSDMKDEIEDEVDLVYDEVFQDKCTPKERLENSTKKKRRRRKSSSVREGSMSEDSAIESNRPVVQKFAVHDVVNGPREEQSGQILDLSESQFGKKAPHQLMAEETAEHTPLQCSPRPDGKVGIKSLKEIMEDEERRELHSITQDSFNTRNSTKADSAIGRNLNQSVKWDSTKKKSQKQRKQESKQGGLSNPSASGTSNAEKEIQKEPFCPWGKPLAENSPARSFKELMTEESQGKIGTPTQKSSDDRVMNGAKRRLSWKELKDEKPEVAHSHSQVNESVWSAKAMAASPPSSSLSLSAIMESQLEEKETSNKILKKPLTLIQIEEKAVEELLLYYNANDNPTEYITVKRIKDVVTRPTWNVTEHR